ncbi:MAG: hypothetical protein QXO71_09185, partial [Candidatus Jordarchaeaceae archaeon]
MIPLQFESTLLGMPLIWGIFVIVWCIIGILIAIWVYRDAESRGENGALWLIIVILTGIIGLIIYLSGDFST